VNDDWGATFTQIDQVLDQRNTLDMNTTLPPEAETAIVKGIIGWLSRLTPAHWFRRTHTLALHPERSWWGLGSIGSEPAMQVNSHWRVTNTTDSPVEMWAVRVHLPFWRRRHKVLYSMVLVRHPHSDIYGSRHPILAHSTSEASVDFWIVPPLKRLGEPLRLTLDLTDQFNNVHRQRGVVFSSTLAIAPPQARSEPIHALPTKLQRDLASVLKSEVTRYQTNGRERGGLGGLTITTQGRRMEFGFTDWRRSGSAQEQSIVPAEAEVAVSSDNYDRLIRIYQASGSDDREAMSTFLLERVDNTLEYAAVAYLIAWFFLSTGRIGAFLQVARDRLATPSDVPLNRFAFSDSLRLIDLLLHYQPGTFDESALDRLEAGLVGVSEHAFRIHERISAIRASRI
jgi:hypothetical protein